jgi:hypothetical protein
VKKDTWECACRVTHWYSLPVCPDCGESRPGTITTPTPTKTEVEAKQAVVPDGSCAAASCPCAYLEEPCHPGCGCQGGKSSRACHYCCGQGNLEQRRSRAKYLVSLIRLGQWAQTCLPASEITEGNTKDQSRATSDVEVPETSSVPEKESREATP